MWVKKWVKEGGEVGKEEVVCGCLRMWVKKWVKKGEMCMRDLNCRVKMGLHNRATLQKCDLPLFYFCFQDFIYASEPNPFMCSYKNDSQGIFPTYPHTNCYIKIIIIVNCHHRLQILSASRSIRLSWGFFYQISEVGREWMYCCKILARK